MLQSHYIGTTTARQYGFTPLIKGGMSAQKVFDRISWNFEIIFIMTLY